jgi:hypothetical protein
MKKIPIRVLRDFAKKYGYTHILMFATDENMRQYVATYGRSITDCDEVAQAGDRLKNALGWPESLHAAPSRVRALQHRVKELETDLETRMNTYQMILSENTSIKAEIEMLRRQVIGPTGIELTTPYGPLRFSPTLVSEAKPETCPGCNAFLPTHAYACPYDPTYPKSLS